MEPFAKKSSGLTTFMRGVKALFRLGRISNKSRLELDSAQDKMQQTAHVNDRNFVKHWNSQFKKGPSRAEWATHAASMQDDKHQSISNRRSGRAIIQFTLAVLVAAIPVSFYLVQPQNISNALASIGGQSGGQMPADRDRFNSGDAGFEQRARDASKLNAARPLQVAENSFGRMQDTLDDTAIEHASKHADPSYICPMHPEVVTNDPNAICPICGMDLVLLETGGETGVVNLTPQVINSLGVRTSKVKRRTLYRRIDSVGYINIDENNMRSVNLRTDGWLERMAVKTEGERVIKGQLLFEIYSPKLVNAQEEYMQAFKHKNDLLLKASQTRLRSLGVSDDQILALETGHNVEQLVKIYAPQTGIVSALRVREGMYVKPSQSVIELVDLSSVWLMVDVFERQAAWVEVGQRAEATLPFMPDKSWEGHVEYVYPSLNAATRSLKVRLRFDNIEEDLKPNMYADVTIYAKPNKGVLSIPKEAVIVTGNQQRVIVALGEGRFIPMSISVGMESGDRVEVTRGLSEGDEVVTSSQFLIDSESSLKASLARMAGGT